MSKEKTVEVNVRLASLFVLIPVLILMGRKIYVDIRDERRGIAYQYRSALQEAFNKGLPYLSIDGDDGKLRAAIAQMRIRRHGKIPEERIDRLRKRLFDLIWTHHIGGFSNYMRLRKPEGIEYRFNTNALPKKRVKEGNTYKLVLDRRPELDSEESILRFQIASGSYDTFYSNFISQVCLDYGELQQIRYMAVGGQTNALFGVHVVRTNSLADPRFCADVIDFVPEKDRWPFTSTNKVARFSLIPGTVVPFGLSLPIPLYFTPETPKQELETTGEITLAYAYFTYKGAHHNGNASVVMAQWHWDKAKARWIPDYFCSGDDYRYPSSRYHTEPVVDVIF